MREATRPAKEATTHGSAALVVVVLLVVLVLLPLLYVLSVGPVVMIYQPGDPGVEFWEWFYTPLEWLHEHVEFTRPWLEWYIELWR